MDQTLKQTILRILDENQIMSVATLRPDGWPQATTVGYAHEGLTLFFLCDPDGQKAKNIAHDPRVSLTINGDQSNIMAITGLSMAARAELVTEPAEATRLLTLLFSRYPAQQGLEMPMPAADQVRIVRLKPVVISVIDYTKGFGHVDLVTV